MEIRFGMTLDGQKGFQPTDALGKETVGPLGFLTILETFLGLTSQPVSQSHRVLQYLELLLEGSETERFYTRSLRVDEIGTAAQLLAWRDLWLLHGWNGLHHPSSSKRILDLAEVEMHTKGRLAPSMGERLHAIEEKLDHRKIPIDEVILVDELASFPIRWQKVLKKLRFKEVAPDTLIPKCPKENFLRKIQLSLLSVTRGQEVEAINYEEDGSFKVVESDTAILSARWLSSQGQSMSTLLVAPTGGELLDEFIEGSGKAAPGLDEASPFRPILQVLPMAIDLLWGPLDPEALMRFMSHPLAPLPSRVRHPLAEALTQQPGVGGRRWQDAMTKIKKYYEGNTSDDLQKIIDRIGFWTGLALHSRDDGVPISAVLELISTIAQHWQSRLFVSDESMKSILMVGLQQLDAARKSLETTRDQDPSVDVISQRQIQQLLRQATQRGSDNPNRYARVGAMLSVTDPAAAIDPADCIIWWQMCMPNLPERWPWSPGEIDALSKTGVELPTVGALLAQAAMDWLRPILNARSELVLMKPPKSMEQHPVWQMIEVLVNGIKPISLETLLSVNASDLVAVTHQRLPERRRYWSFDRDLSLYKRDKESFSSLEKFLFNPYHWLLEYPAGLRKSKRLRISEGPLLLGNLSHALVEQLVSEYPTLAIDQETFDEWFAREFDRKVAEEGGSLLLPGRGADLHAFRLKLKQGMQRLIEFMRTASIQQVESERKLTGQYGTGESILEGSADLVLKRGDGNSAVLDMKWSGSARFGDKLKHQRHLQLVMYAELMRQEEKSVPAVGYFILDQGKLLTTSDAWFPGVNLIHPKNPLTHEAAWNRFRTTLTWRQAQFKEGRVELAFEDIEASDAETIPEDGLELEIMNPNFNDYRFLAGWAN
jgi:hypothetical protein